MFISIESVAVSMECNTPVVAAEELSGDADEVYYGLLRIGYNAETGEYVFEDTDSGHVFETVEVNEFDTVEDLATKIDMMNNEILQQL